MAILPDDRTANLLVWVLLWAALFAWQAITVTSPRLPTIAAVVRALRRWWLTRALLVLGWWWLGWHLFVRTTF